MEEREMRKMLLHQLISEMDKQDITPNFRPEIETASDKVDTIMGPDTGKAQAAEAVAADPMLEPEKNGKRSKAAMNLHKQLSYK